jgi:hypothetical protein
MFTGLTGASLFETRCRTEYARWPNGNRRSRIRFSEERQRESRQPRSRAAPRATVKILAEMSKRSTYKAYRAALPVLGVDGSLAGSGLLLPAKGHVFAKTGTTVSDGALKAQVLAGSFGQQLPSLVPT